ncbi:MAG: protein kinase [Phycisphaerales bacterium]|nr:protein kinase [Planctomycetota bacterium]
MPRSEHAIPGNVDPSRFNLVREIFLDAQRFRGHARRAFLKQRCQGDSDLLAQVVDLLKHDESDSSVLDKPLVQMDRPVDKPSTRMLRRPQTVKEIGRFHLLQVLGEGASGITSLAKHPQSASRRAVVKVLHPELATPEAFEAIEPRITVDFRALGALRQHASSRLIECGRVADGSIFVATDFVPGEPILTYCDRVRAPIRTRIFLFLDACAAVHAAHQCGVFHAGITPGNALVRMAGDVPTVTVLDFGVARALHDDLGRRREWVQARLAHGAVEYLAPEQVGETPRPADAATDVYGLGALLYELLVGAPVFDRFALRRAGMGDFPRILEEQAPRDPGAHAAELCKASPDVADRRSTGTKELPLEIKHDLASIVLKAIQKSPVSRYATAESLADDLRNHLDAKPVSAAPGFGQRVKSLVDRFRTGS